GSDRRGYLGDPTVLQLRRIESTRHGSALARPLLLGRAGLIGAVTFARAPRGPLSAIKPPEPKAQHDGGGDDAKARSRERRRAEERHRNGVLQRWRPGQRR